MRPYENITVIFICLSFWNHPATYGIHMESTWNHTEKAYMMLHNVNMM